MSWRKQGAWCHLSCGTYEGGKYIKAPSKRLGGWLFATLKVWERDKVFALQWHINWVKSSESPGTRFVRFPFKNLEQESTNNFDVQGRLDRPALCCLAAKLCYKRRQKSSKKLLKCPVKSGLAASLFRMSKKGGFYTILYFSIRTALLAGSLISLHVWVENVKWLSVKFGLFVSQLQDINTPPLFFYLNNCVISQISIFER